MVLLLVVCDSCVFGVIIFFVFILVRVSKLPNNALIFI